MKIVLGVILFFISCVSFAMECSDPNEIIYYSNPLLNRKCYWFDRVNEFKKSGEQASIVMIGDSITQHGNWNEIFNSNDVANRGIGGDTAALILERVGSIYSVNPSTAYIMVGINDFYRGASVDEVLTSYNLIINGLLHRNIRVNVLSTLYCNSKMNLPVCKEANIKIGELNTRLSLMDNIRFIDLNIDLSERNELKKEYTIDGIHLNKDGYDLISTLLTEH